MLEKRCQLLVTGSMSEAGVMEAGVLLACAVAEIKYPDRVWLHDFNTFYIHFFPLFSPHNFLPFNSLIPSKINTWSFQLALILLASCLIWAIIAQGTSTIINSAIELIPLFWYCMMFLSSATSHVALMLVYPWASVKFCMRVIFSLLMRKLW